VSISLKKVYISFVLFTSTKQKRCTRIIKKGK
jgi:hypothetical protein